MTTRLSDIPTEQLQRMLRETEIAAGKDSVSAQVLRRELERRQSADRQQEAAR